MEALVSEKRHELIKTVSEVDSKLAEAFCNGKPISAADLKVCEQQCIYTFFHWSFAN